MGTLKYFDNTIRMITATYLLTGHVGAVNNQNSNYASVGSGDIWKPKDFTLKEWNGTNKQVSNYQGTTVGGIFCRTVQIFASTETLNEYSSDKYQMSAIGSTAYSGLLTVETDKLNKIFTVNVTNNTEESITINSLFGKLNGYLYSGSSGNVYDVLAWAYYLDEPVTIQPNTT